MNKRKWKKKRKKEAERAFCEATKKMNELAKVSAMIGTDLLKAVAEVNKAVKDWEDKVEKEDFENNG